MSQRGAAIYFSATGNTRYISKLLKNNFKNKGIEVDLIDIQKHECLVRDYDFYIFGSPIHADMFPKMYVEWVNKNIKNQNKKCIVYSTLSDIEDRKGRIYFSKLLDKKGLDIIVNKAINMPNNYTIGPFKMDSDEKIKQLISSSKVVAKEIVYHFINLNKTNIDTNKSTISSEIVFNMFNTYSKNFAKKKFSLNDKKCIDCNICERQCPVNNIKMDNKKIEFSNKCISCMKCIHRCPGNAILYKSKPFKQYKIENYIIT